MDLFKIEYYETDRRGYTNTVHDNVLASNEKDAYARFDTHHPDITSRIIVDIWHVHY